MVKRRSRTTKRAAAPRKPATRTEGTREKLLRAALQEFANGGYEGARTRDIAARAGVNQGLLTYHFSSKELLWKAAVDQVFEQMRASFESKLEVLRDIEPKSRARVLIRHFVRFAAAHPELHRLMIQEGKSDGPRMQWLVDRHVRPLYEISCAVIVELQAQRVLPKNESLPLHLHYIMVGAVSLLFTMAPEVLRLSGVDPLQPSVIDAHADVISSLWSLLTEPATRAH